MPVENNQAAPCSWRGRRGGFAYALARVSSEKNTTKTYSQILREMEAPKSSRKESPRKPIKINDTTRNKVLGATGGVLALLLTVYLAWAYWPVRVPAPNESPLTLAKFAATDKFAGMSMDQKQPYLDAMEKVPWDQRRDIFGKLSDDQRQAIFTNAFGARRMKTIQDYLALPTQKEKLAYLDKIIDQQKPRPNNGPRGGGGMRGDPGRMKAMLERMPPTRRQQMADFVGALNARRQQRGMTATGPGR
jgi:hypothetical protein